MGSVSLFCLLLAGAGDPQQPLNRSQPPDPPAATRTSTDDADAPITGIGRLNWAVKQTIGPANLWVGVLDAGWGTGFDRPREYGVSLLGFAKRYGLDLSGTAVENTMEASIGAFWGENPRYHRADSGHRFQHAIKMAFLSENRSGDVMPAYARFIGIAGGNALEDTWRPDSERNARNTFFRIGEGFGGRILTNLWDEFWPDIRPHMPWNKH